MIKRILRRLMAPKCHDCGTAIVGRRAFVQCRAYHPECVEV